ncbi:prolipoprotein diacylglyceryl transferase family protein [Hymenobacter algoricola]|uniref:Diacylglyceryl transferase n=1 Tax=Hymenobacter algoricola TaxID=486267 RepID=A0ABP7MQ08_9BACT
MTHPLLLTAVTWAVPAHPGYDFYTLCYVLAFALNLLLLVWEGHRRGYPLRTWLVLLACTTLTFILGTKLLAFTATEWQQLLRSGHWPDSEARTVLGGALAGTLTLLALRRRFGFSWHVFDAFTLPMCAALVVQCVGCVLTGCCFGEVTAGGWGLTYAPGTLPYLVQWSQGLIPYGAAHSLPVHPTQLYSLLLCAGVGAVLVLTRHHAWPGGSRRLLHLGLLLTGRFIIEFWRAPAGEQVGATLHSHGGIVLKQVQWALLLLIPVALGTWGLLVRRARRQPLAPERIPVLDSRLNLLAVAALLALTAWLGPLALTLPEVLVIKTLLLTVLVLEAAALLLSRPAPTSAARPRRLALPLGLAGTVLLLTSQAPADSARSTTLEVSLGAGKGAFYEDVRSGGGGGCSGNPTRDTYDHRYSLRGGNLELHGPKAPSRPWGSGCGRVSNAPPTGASTPPPATYASRPTAPGSCWASTPTSGSLPTCGPTASGRDFAWACS